MPDPIMAGAAPVTAAAPPVIDYDRIAAGLKMLGNATRLKVLHLLAGGEQDAGAICMHVGLRQPRGSHHLQLLRLAGLIEPRRRGKHSFYALTGTGERIIGAVLDGFAAE